MTPSAVVKPRAAEAAGPGLTLDVSLPKDMDPGVAESIRPRIERALQLLVLAEQPAVIEDADRIAELLSGKIEPSTGLVEARLARLKTIRAILEDGEWLTAEELNALQPNPPAQKSQPASDWKRRGRVFSVSHGGRDYYPRYGFDEAFQPLPVIRDVLKAFGEMADTWKIAAWFQFPNGWISKPGTGGEEPVAPKDALDQREALLRAVAARQGSYMA